MTRFDENTLAVLAEYEDFFYKAINADWSPNPGHHALTEMQLAMEQFAGRTERLNESCNTCILRLIKEAGQKFYADREAVINAANDKKAVEMSTQPAAMRKKVKVSTNKS